MVVCFPDSHYVDTESQCNFDCISFMAEDIEHFFMYLFIICTSFKTVQFICPFIDYIVCSSVFIQLIYQYILFLTLP
jgi:hypothetical protein